MLIREHQLQLLWTSKCPQPSSSTHINSAEILRTFKVPGHLSHRLSLREIILASARLHLQPLVRKPSCSVQQPPSPCRQEVSLTLVIRNMKTWLAVLIYPWIWSLAAQHQALLEKNLSIHISWRKKIMKKRRKRSRYSKLKLLVRFLKFTLWTWTKLLLAHVSWISRPRSLPNKTRHKALKSILLQQKRLLNKSAKNAKRGWMPQREMLKKRCPWVIN